MAAHLQATTEAAIGFDRLKKFLLLENRLQRFSTPLDKANAIEIVNATVAWTAVQNTSEDEPTGTACRLPSPVHRQLLTTILFY